MSVSAFQAQAAINLFVHFEKKSPKYYVRLAYAQAIIISVTIATLISGNQLMVQLRESQNDDERVVGSKCPSETTSLDSMSGKRSLAAR